MPKQRVLKYLLRKFTITSYASSIPPSIGGGIKCRRFSFGLRLHAKGLPSRPRSPCRAFGGGSPDGSPSSAKTSSARGFQASATDQSMPMPIVRPRRSCTVRRTKKRSFGNSCRTEEIAFVLFFCYFPPFGYNHLATSISSRWRKVSGITTVIMVR